MGPMTLRDIMIVLRKYNHLGTREWYVDTPGGVVYSNVVQVKIGRTEGDEIARKYHASGEPAPPAESGVEECLAAINRAKHRGFTDWSVEAVSRRNFLGRLDHDELLGLGRLLIERERAAAKGGAE